MQGLGYADEVSDVRRRDSIEAVTAAVADLPAFELTFDRPRLHREAIAIHPVPTEPLHTLWQTIRDGIATGLGPDAVRTGPVAPLTG